MGVAFDRGVAFLEGVGLRAGKFHLPGTCRRQGGASPVMWISSAVGARISSCRRPRRSVWSTPHREGTLRTQRRCTFISQPGRAKLGFALQALPQAPDSIPPRHRHWAFEGAPEAPSSGLSSERRLTGAFHALMYQPVKEGATVVAEGGATVAVQAEFVLVPRILGAERSLSGVRQEAPL